MALPPECWLCGGYVLAKCPEVDPINLGTLSQYIGSNTVETRGMTAGLHEGRPVRV